MLPKATPLFKSKGVVTQCKLHEVNETQNTAEHPAMLRVPILCVGKATLERATPGSAGLVPTYTMPLLHCSGPLIRVYRCPSGAKNQAL